MSLARLPSPSGAPWPALEQPEGLLARYLLLEGDSRDGPWLSRTLLSRAEIWHLDLRRSEGYSPNYACLCPLRVFEQLLSEQLTSDPAAWGRLRLHPDTRCDVYNIEKHILCGPATPVLTTHGIWRCTVWFSGASRNMSKQSEGDFNYSRP